MTQPARITSESEQGASCPECGYDLRGSNGDRCPECGLAVEGTGPQVAWERRRRVGRVVAFARTAWGATVRPGRVAGVVMRRAHVRSARRFRVVVLTIVGSAIIAAFVTVVAKAGGPTCLGLVPDPADAPVWAAGLGGAAVCWSAGAMFWPVLPVGLVVTLLAGTRWDHWFAWPSQPPGQRNRAMAGAMYMVAPMLACVAAAGAGVVWFETDLFDHWAMQWVIHEVWMIAAIGVAVLVLAPARYAAALPGGGWGRAFGVFVGITVQWAVAVAVGLGLLPTLVGLAWVMVDSLR